MADVLCHRVDTPAPRHGGEAVEGVLASDVGEQVAGQVVETRRRADAAPAHDVLVQDGIPEGPQVVFPVHVSEQRFRVPAALRVAAQVLCHPRPGARAGVGAQGFGE